MRSRVTDSQILAALGKRCLPCAGSRHQHGHFLQVAVQVRREHAQTAAGHACVTSAFQSPEDSGDCRQTSKPVHIRRPEQPVRRAAKCAIEFPTGFSRTDGSLLVCRFAHREFSRNVSIPIRLAAASS